MVSQKTVPKQPKLIEQTETAEQLTKQLARGGGIAFVGSIVGKAAALGLHILLGRVLGPGAYGLYALGASVTGIAQSVGSLGLNQGVVRFCSMYRGEKDNAHVKGTILSALAISLVSSILVAGIIFLFSSMIAQKFFHEPGLTWVLRIFALALPFYVLMGITTSFSQAFRRIEYQQGVKNVFHPLVNLALVGLAFLLGFKLAGAVYGFLISGILSLGLGFYFLWRIFPDIILTVKSSCKVGELLRYALPMLLVDLSYLMAFRIDRLMLGALRDTKEVGLYSAAAAIGLHVGVIHNGLVSIFMPIISDVNNKRQHTLLKQTYNIVKRWSSYGTFLIVLPIIFYPQATMLIFGKEFIVAWSALIILVLRNMIGAITGPKGALLQMTGKQNVELGNGLIWLASNVGFNYLLIPTYGFLGAAMATLLASLLMSGIRLLEIHHFFRFHPFDPVHVRFLVLVLAISLVGVMVGIWMTGVFKLLSFFVISGVFMTYIYRDRTETDLVVWVAIKRRLKGVVSW